MLPRHLIPLALGFAAFVMAEAASDITPDQALPYAVACVADRIAIETSPRLAACRYERFAARDAAERFAREQFGGIGEPCSCD